MSDLKTEYQEIEESLNWPEKPGVLCDDQLYKLVKELRSKVRQRSLSENLDPVSYEDRLFELSDFLSDLQLALNHRTIQAQDEGKNEQHVWVHQTAVHQTSGFLRKDDLPDIDRGSLLMVAAKYLANPWLQHDPIDWILIDSLIFAEISAYFESILTGQALGKANWEYFEAGGDIEKAQALKLKKLFGFFVLRYIVPPILIFVLYYNKYEKACLTVGVAYAIYLLFHTILWPVRNRKRKLEQKAFEEHANRLQKMINAYFYCKPPIVSLATLGIYLNKAIEDGAIFDGALFSILKRIEAIRGEAFLPFAEKI